MAGRRGRHEGSIYQLPDGSWRGAVTIGYAPNGRQLKKYFRGKTRDSVRVKVNKGLREAGSAVLHTPERVTVSEWLDQYLALREPELREKTLSNYRHYIAKVKPELGHLQMAKVSPLQVRRFYGRLARTGLSPSVRQHLHHFMHGAFREAMGIGLVERNIIDAVPRPRGGQVVQAKVWTPGEAQRFLNAAKADRMYPAFYVLLSLGPRVGEMLALRWSDLEGDRLYIRRTMSSVKGHASFGPPKTERSKRDLYLAPDALRVLRAHKARLEEDQAVAKRWADSDLMFPTQVGTPFLPENFRRTYRRLLKAAGVPAIRIHDLRHTYITFARDAGIDPEVVANRAGQDVRVTISIYSKVTEERKRKAALSLSQLLGEVAP